MTHSAGPGIVVGVDGSPDSTRAVVWAAADAARRRLPLHLVHACGGPRVAYPPPGFALPVADLPDPDPHAARVLAEAVVCARDVAAELTVTSRPLRGRPVPVLLAASRQETQLVVGGRGAGGFTGLFTGSTAAQLADHATCPVVVVRARTGPVGPNEGRVVLGVDSSPSAMAAVRFAFDQAASRGVGLTAVHAYEPPIVLEGRGIKPDRSDHDSLVDAERRASADAVAETAADFPDVDLHLDLTAGRTARVLVDASGGAELVVVGARGHGGFPGLLLGSVGRALLHHAPCPVAIVRARTQRAAGGGINK